ncbi:MAG: hypothetical protein J6A56_02300 [Clostridia bacterium]|nr:hypothetical protein [Clostridia bacterium]
MAKKLFKSLTLGVVVFAAAILVGYLAYTATYQYQTEKIREAMTPEDFVSAAPAYREANPGAEGETVWVDYYLARLENDNIAIYMVSEEDVSFLYTLDVYTGNFPAAELIRLKEGIVLKNRQELAAFEEDYTS